MLFKSTELQENKPIENGKAAESLTISNNFRFLEGDKLAKLEQKIGTLYGGRSLYFKTDGAWSAIDLIEYCLAQSGPSNVYFSTWSIGPEAIRHFNEWQKNGQIMSIFGIIDEGFRNRKPDLFEQAKQAFPNLKFTKSHAKVTIIQGERLSITLMGSANMTKNPRTEVGVIIVDRSLADSNIQWILNSVSNG